MQRLIFETEHEQFRDSVRRFFQREIAPHAKRWREQGYVDREAYLKAGAQGYLLMWADEQYGGAGIDDFRYEQIVYEENIAHGEIGFYINLHSGLVAPYIGELGTLEQKARLLIAIAVRALVPAGYMLGPAQEPGRFLTVTLCSMYGAVETVLDQKTGEYLPAGQTAPADDQQQSHSDTPCVFATAAPLAVPEQAPVPAQLFAIEATPVLAALDVAPGRGLAAPPPWSTGPPRTV